MKLLIWSPSIYLGGGLRLLTRLIISLAERPEVDKLTFVVGKGGGFTTLKAVICNPKVDLVEVIDGKGESDLKRIWGLKGTGRLRKLASEAFHRGGRSDASLLFEELAQECDLVYVFWPHRQDFPQVDKPIVCTFQDATFFDFPEILGKQETDKELERSRIWLKMSDQVVVSSESTKDILIRIFGIHCQGFDIIRHAISPIAMDESDSNLTSAIKLPENYIVCPAGVYPHKNHYVLLSAWARFARRQACPLVLLGPGTDQIGSIDYCGDWHFTRLSGLLYRTNLVKGIDYYGLGYVSDRDVASIIRNAKALVMPTLAEGGGSYPVEEALGMGVPALCSDIKVLREQLMGRSVAVGWFDPESPESIVKALDHLMDNYDNYKQGTLRAAADPRPNWDDIGLAYVRVFQSTIKRFNNGKSKGI